jgi:4-amino-4-deoxy-L-arabinose transferase-like glycosyltransferase
MKNGTFKQFVKANALLLIILLGFGIRIVFFISLQPWKLDVIVNSIIVQDAVEYHQLAVSLLTDHSFENFDALRTPVYPMFVALIYKLSGFSIPVVLMIQILLNLISIWLTYKIAELIFSKKIALLSAFLFSINIHQALYAVTLCSDTFFIFLFLISTLYLCKWIKEKKLRFLIISSVMLGVSTLERPVSFLFPFIVVLLILFLDVKPKQKLICASQFCLVFLITISPWLLRNYSVFGEAKLTTQTGNNLLFCNVSATEAYKTEKSYETIRQEYRDYFKSQGIDTVTNPFRKSDIYGDYAKKYIKENFTLYCQRHVLGIVNMYTAIATKHISSIFHIRSRSLSKEQIKGVSLIKRFNDFFQCKTFEEQMMAVGLGIYLFVNYIFLLVALIILIRKKNMFALFFLLIILYFSFITGVIGDARLRMPVMPFINILCAFGIFYFLERRKSAQNNILNN